MGFIYRVLPSRAGKNRQLSDKFRAKLHFITADINLLALKCPINLNSLFSALSGGGGGAEEIVGVALKIPHQRNTYIL